MKRQRGTNQTRTKLHYEELEARILLSAGAEALLGGSAIDDSALLNQSPPAVQLINADSQSNSVSDSTKLTTRLEVVFIDGSLPDADALLADLINESDPDREFQVIVLDNTRSGIDQITEALQSLQNVDAVHFITHGSAGNIQLGSTMLNGDNLDSFRASVANWSLSLSEDADLLFYGCNLAATVDGQGLMEKIGGLTGADVAASDDITGNSELGGNWEFEYKLGQIESSVAFSNSMQHTWQGTLIVSLNNLSGDALAYTEGDGAVVIDQGTSASATTNEGWYDATTPGSLTVSFTSGSYSAEDVLAVRNQGSGGGQIGVSGSNITYGGLTIGTYTGGTSGTNLVITFNNSNANNAGTIDALLRNITYQNTDTDNPTTGARTVNFLLRDGDGQTANVNTSATISRINDAPTLGNLAGDNLAYTEGDGAVVMDQGAAATVADVDSANFDTGTLTVSFTAGNDNAEDVLAIRNQGVGAGQIGIAGSNVTYAGVTIGTYVGGTAGADLVITLNTNATVAATQALVQNITYQNTDTDAPTAGARTVRFVLTDGDGGTSSNYDMTVTVSGANDAPTLGNLAGDSLAYTEGDGAVVMDQGTAATVADVDSANFDTGTLTISFIAGSDNAEDVLAIRNQGVGAGQIGVSGSNVTYAGVTIGTYVGGTAGTNLVITLNANATVAATQALVQNITYQNTDTDAPTTGARTVRFVLTDGDGGTSTNYDMTVTVSGSNDAPTLGNLAGDNLAYTEGDGTVVMDQGTAATVADVDSANFDTGTLTVSFTAGNDNAEDVLAIRNQGVGAGQIGIAGSNVTYAGVTIGTYVGGTAGADLVITLNTNATVAATQALVQNITYQNTDTDAPTTGARTVRFVLTDGDGGTSTNYDMTVTVSGSNDAPTLGNLAGDNLAYTEGDGAVVMDQGTAATVADVDSANFDTGTLTVSFTAGNDNTEDVLAIRNQGVGAGQIGIAGSNVTYAGVTIGTYVGGTAGADLVITLNTNATVAATQALVQNITYQNTDTGARTVRFVLTDGDGGTSSNYDMTVTVSGANDAPTAANGTITTLEDTAHIFSAAEFSFGDVDGDALVQIQITALETAGSLQLNGIDVTLNQVIAVADINAGNLRFVPAANANGLSYDSFQFRVHDGTTYSAASYSMTIDVTAVNDAPTASNGTITFNENTSHVFSIADFNFSDVDTADALVQVRVSSLAGSGQLQLNGLGVNSGQVISAADIAAGRLVFTPLSNAFGNNYFSMSYNVHDGVTYSASANSVTMNVSSVNTAPTSISLDALSVNDNVDSRNGYVVANISASDNDPGETFTYSVIGGTDANMFSIVGNRLVLTNGFIDYETQSSFSILVRVTDSNGNSYDQPFSLAVIDQADPMFSKFNVNIKSDTITRDSANDTTSSEASESDRFPAGALGTDLSDSGQDLLRKLVEGLGHGDSDNSDIEDFAASLRNNANGLALDKNTIATTLARADGIMGRLLAQAMGNDPDDAENNGRLSFTTADLQLDSPVYKALDSLREQLRNDLGYTSDEEIIVVGTVKGSTVAFTAGVGIWALRGSSLLAAFASSIPMWTGLDPLPILSKATKTRDGENVDMVDKLFG